MGFELQRAEFTLDDNLKSTSATISIDGKERPEWTFGLHFVGNNTHVIGVACGPPSEAIATYRQTLAAPTEASSTQVISIVSCVTSLQSSNVLRPFTVLNFEDLIPKNI